MAAEQERLLVCFVAVKNWSQGIQGRPDKEVFAFLNDLYETVLPIAEDHDGRIVKVMGDAAMIIYRPRDTAKAIEAVRKMRERFDELQKAFEPAVPLQLSGAMDVGPAIAREMGPEAIRTCDVIGQPVNTATELQPDHDFVITRVVADEAGETDLGGIEIVETPQEDEA